MKEVWGGKSSQPVRYCIRKYSITHQRTAIVENKKTEYSTPYRTTAKYKIKQYQYTMPRPISLPNRNIEQYCTIYKNTICGKLKTQIKINTEIDTEIKKLNNKQIKSSHFLHFSIISYHFAKSTSSSIFSLCIINGYRII